MRKLVLFLIAFLALVTYFRVFASPESGAVPAAIEVRKTING